MNSISGLRLTSFADEIKAMPETTNKLIHRIKVLLSFLEKQRDAYFYRAKINKQVDACR